MDELKDLIREVPDFPEDGILFYDITTLLKDPLGLRMLVDSFVWLFAREEIDQVVGIESRGFMFGPIVAYNMNAGFVPVRKPGKLPAETVSASYDLEYGSDTLELHRDAISEGERVLVVDDLVATGGTARATAEMVEELGGEIVGMAFAVELTFLEPRKALAGYQVESLIQY